jgi:hypothetical protein
MYLLVFCRSPLFISSQMYKSKYKQKMMSCIHIIPFCMYHMSCDRQWAAAVAWVHTVCLAERRLLDGILADW